jgi:hypothetical protein
MGPECLAVDYFTNNRRSAEYWGGRAIISIHLNAPDEAASRAQVAVRYAARLLDKR